MSNEIERTGNGLRPVYDENYGISSGLWWAIDRTEHPHRDIGRPKEFRLEVKQDAQIRLNRIAPLCVAAGPELVAAWATPLLAGLSKDTSPEAAEARIRMVVLALQELAAGAFTQSAQAAVARRAHFTPMPADLYDELAPRSFELRQRQATLKYIVEAATEGGPIAVTVSSVTSPVVFSGWTSTT